MTDKELDEVEPRDAGEGDAVSFLEGEDADANDDENEGTKQETTDEEPSDHASSSDVSSDEPRSGPGIVEYDDGSRARRMTVYFPVDVGKKIELLSVLENKKLSDVVNEAMAEYLEDKDVPDL